MTAAEKGFKKLIDADRAALIEDMKSEMAGRVAAEVAEDYMNILAERAIEHFARYTQTLKDFKEDDRK